MSHATEMHGSETWEKSLASQIMQCRSAGTLLRTLCTWNRTNARMNPIDGWRSHAAPGDTDRKLGEKIDRSLSISPFGKTQLPNFCWQTCWFHFESLKREGDTVCGLCAHQHIQQYLQNRPHQRTEPTHIPNAIHIHSVSDSRTDCMRM